MSTVAQVIEFIQQETGAIAGPETDIVGTLGVQGDDFFELMHAFSKKFKVDMSDFCWYFHSGEEGFNFPGRFFFKPPDERVQRIPVTPVLLNEFAKAQKWNLNYPLHELPGKRIDLLINKLFLSLLGILTLVLLFFKLR